MTVTSVPLTSVPLLSRIWLSFVCAWRIAFDPQFAASVLSLREAERAPEPLPAPEAVAAPLADSAVSAPAVPAPAAASSGGALQLLSLLQREGRFLDFVQQDVAAFGDADVGAAARVVHDGCRRALEAHARVVHVRLESEGSALTLEQASEDVKLVGNVAGSAPFRGILRHRGWRVEELRLPTLVGSRDPKIVAPAELELS